MARSNRLPVLGAFLSLVLAACGGGGEDPPANPGDPADPDPGGSGGGVEETFSVGGSVTGLTGSGLVISNNGAEELTIDAPGTFSFSDELGDGEAYEVTVASQPGAPVNVCTLANNTGTIDGADVTDVEILCTGPLAVTGAAPADGDQDVSRTVEPLLTFSAGIDAGTVVADAITLASDAGPVDVTFDVTGAQVALTPDAVLLPLTEYTLTITTDVLGSDGERMLDPVTIMFKTRDAMWHPDIPIDAGTGTANGVEVAFDADGNALALWQQAGAGGTGIWWNYYTAGTGWGTATELETYGANEFAGSPQVGFHGDGEAVAVWTLEDSVLDIASVRGSRYVPGAGWEPPDFIEDETGNVFGAVDLAVSASGMAAATWVQDDGGQMNVWANRYSAGSGWGDAEIIDDTDDVVDYPRVAINHDGSILVVWQVRDPGNFNWDVVARRYPAGGNWEAPDILSDGTFEAVTPRVVLDDEGNGLVIWEQGLGLDAAIHASRFTEAGNWTEPEELSVSGAIDDPELAIDPFGNAIAVWEQQESVNGTLELLPYAARHTSSDGWDEPRAIGHRTAFWPKVALDASGNAIAAWYEIDLNLPPSDAYSVWGNRFTVDNGWTAPEQIGSNGGLIGTGMPNIAVDPSGDAFAAWTRSGEVRVNRFE
ncbi:MAG TPA: Ig-like domain-containing protein [Woeseiaceae bacterium]|nr:Ig-like domain-containing protein [Woeseiaceae bacterium]